MSKAFTSLLVIFSLTLVFLPNTFAASLQVTPVNLFFNSKENAKAVYLSNSGDTVLRAQLRLYRWDQKDAQEILTEATDLIVSPPFTQIPAGKTQLVRILMNQTVEGNREKSWRLIVDELPPDRNIASTTDNEINFLLRYSVPVFAGDGTLPDLNRVHMWLDNERLWVKNDNLVHIKLSNVKLIEGKREVKITAGLMGYVLAGREMSWPVGAGSLGKRKIEFSLNDSPVLQTLPLQSP
ncbi:fimbrial biogenesis chaperone [Citrobacter koseri]|uniref:fimbrial biogenesis chaperone n=1 Tax=Citrobacter koseri TaxID=545 RepID=UPI0038915B00